MPHIFSRTIDKKLKAQLNARDGNVCQYCGIVLPHSIIMEHVIPLKKGGHTALYNMVISCYKCNVNKSNTIWIPENINALKIENADWACKIINKSNGMTRDRFFSEKEAREQAK